MMFTRHQIDCVDAPALGDVVAGRAGDMSQEERQKRMEYAALVASLTQYMRSFWANDGVSDRDLTVWCVLSAMSCKVMTLKRRLRRSNAKLSPFRTLSQVLLQ